MEEDSSLPIRGLEKEWNLDNTTHNLRISPERLQDPETRQYLLALNIAQNLAHNLERAAAIHSKRPLVDIIMEYHHNPQLSPFYRETMPAVEGFDPSLEHRYAGALHLARPLTEMLSEGFGEFVG